MERLAKQFNTDGFVSLPAFVHGEELQELQANVRRLTDQVVPQIPAEHVFYEDTADPSSLKQIQHVGEHDPWFGKLFTSGRFRELAEYLLGGDVVAQNMQYFNKPPQVSQPTPPHQDGYYFMLSPCIALTMWLALDVTDETNGCVRYARGSHRRGMRNHARTNTLGFSQGIVDYPSREDRRHEVAIAAEPGDLLVHHALTIHRADENRSGDRNRRAIGLIYYNAAAQADEVAHAEYQRQLRREWSQSGRL